jgi:DNA-directed RNA polymerase alpha subunit
VFDFLGHDMLGHRTARMLAREGLRTVEAVLAAREGDLMDVRNFGVRCLERVRYAKEVHALAQTSTDDPEA